MSERPISRRVVLRSGLGIAAALAALPLPHLLPVTATQPELSSSSVPGDEDGYRLWLRYRRVTAPQRIQDYARAFSHVVHEEESEVILAAAAELSTGLSAVVGRPVPVNGSAGGGGAVTIGTWEGSPAIRQVLSRKELERLGPDGFVIHTDGSGNHTTVYVGSIGPAGAMYGAFHLLRLLHTTQPRMHGLHVAERPVFPVRMLNHWDNLNGTIERGYAGRSIFWDGGRLRDTPERHRDYGRALASLGINAITVSNVNASGSNADILGDGRRADLVELGRRLGVYGVQLFLSPSFASPISVGGLTTADPLDPAVRDWWATTVTNLAHDIPTFAGFVVKADSEGQPGPNTYGRNHADGANMLARALASIDGTVYWRAFVYGASSSDRAKQAYEAFTPLDGQFDENVVIQIKNGPFDFQVREPVSPLFELSQSAVSCELQITQEYTGQATHLCYLPSQWASYLDTVVRDDGTQFRDRLVEQEIADRRTALVGVANVGDETNWTGHHLAAANFYGFGRLAWNPATDPSALAKEWAQQTFDASAVEPITGLLDESWATFERYTSPLGVGVMADVATHFNPSPATRTAYHRADATGVGYDRTNAGGSGYTSQYPPGIAARLDSRDTVPEELLLFLHHVPYTSRLRSGPTLIQHIYDTHFDGAQQAAGFVDRWDALEGVIDRRRHAEIRQRFVAQREHSLVWRNSLVGYFHGVSGIRDEGGRLDLTVSAVSAPPVALIDDTIQVIVTIGAAPGTDREHHVSVGASAPAGWTVSATTATVPSGGSVVVPLLVHTGPTPDVADLTVSVELDGVPLVAAVPQLTVLTTPPTSSAAVAVDFGSATSPAAPGFRRVGPSDNWGDGPAPGWVSGSPDSRDRGSSIDDLRRDFVLSRTPATLRVHVPGGTHHGWALTGDLTSSTHDTRLSIGDRVIGNSGAQPAGAFRWFPFTVDGGPDGREVDLGVTSDDGVYWRLNALVLE